MTEAKKNERENPKMKNQKEDHEDLTEDLEKLNKQEIALLSRLLILSGSRGMSLTPDDVMVLGGWLFNNCADRERVLNERKEG